MLDVTKCFIENITSVVCGAASVCSGLSTTSHAERMTFTGAGGTPRDTCSSSYARLLLRRKKEKEQGKEKQEE